MVLLAIGVAGDQHRPIGQNLFQGFDFGFAGGLY
jgi:hypothetical protein